MNPYLSSFTQFHCDALSCDNGTRHYGMEAPDEYGGIEEFVACIRGYETPEAFTQAQATLRLHAEEAGIVFMDCFVVSDTYTPGQANYVIAVLAREDTRTDEHPIRAEWWGEGGLVYLPGLVAPKYDAMMMQQVAIEMRSLRAKYQK